MKLTRIFILLCVFGCLANDSTENKGITRIYLFGDPIGYLPGRTGVQDMNFGILHWNGEKCDCPKQLWTFELKIFHWYFDEYQMDYSRFITDTAKTPGGFNAWGMQVAVERVIPFSLFHWPFFPALCQPVNQPEISGWVLGVGWGMTAYTPAGGRAGSFSPDWFWNGTPFIGVQVEFQHFLFGVRGGYAHEEELAGKTNFMTSKRGKFVGSIVIGGTIYRDPQKK